MQANVNRAAILGLLFLTACDPDRPRVEIATPDRAQFATCLSAGYDKPVVPAYQTVTVNGVEYLPLALVRQRDKLTASFTAQVIYAHSLCRASTRYADRWTEEMQQSPK